MGINGLRQFLADTLEVAHTRIAKSYRDFGPVILEDVMTRLYLSGSANTVLTGNELARRILAPYFEVFPPTEEKTNKIVYLAFDIEDLKPELKKRVSRARRQASDLPPYGPEYQGMRADGIYNTLTGKCESFHLFRLLHTPHLKDAIGYFVRLFLVNDRPEGWSKSTWIRIECAPPPQSEVDTEEDESKVPTHQTYTYVYDPWNRTQGNNVLQRLSRISCAKGEAELSVLEFLRQLRTIDPQCTEIVTMTRDQDMLALCLYHFWDTLNAFHLEWTNEIPHAGSAKDNVVDVSRVRQGLASWPKLTRERFLYFCLTKGTDFFNRKSTFHGMRDEKIWTIFSGNYPTLDFLVPELSVSEFQAMVYLIYYHYYWETYRNDFAGAPSLRKAVDRVAKRTPKRMNLPETPYLWCEAWRAFHSNVLYWRNLVAPEEPPWNTSHSLMDPPLDPVVPKQELLVANPSIHPMQSIPLPRPLAVEMEKEDEEEPLPPLKVRVC
jgi:hypothetical protein